MHLRVRILWRWPDAPVHTLRQLAHQNVFNTHSGVEEKGSTKVAWG